MIDIFNLKTPKTLPCFETILRIIEETLNISISDSEISKIQSEEDLLNFFLTKDIAFLRYIAFENLSFPHITRLYAEDIITCISSNLLINNNKYSFEALSVITEQYILPYRNTRDSDHNLNSQNIKPINMFFLYKKETTYEQRQLISQIKLY